MDGRAGESVHPGKVTLYGYRETGTVGCMNEGRNEKVAVSSVLQNLLNSFGSPLMIGAQACRSDPVSNACVEIQTGVSGKFIHFILPYIFFTSLGLYPLTKAELCAHSYPCGWLHGLRDHWSPTCKFIGSSQQKLSVQLLVDSKPCLDATSIDCQ